MNGKELYISMYHYTRDLNHSRYPRIKGLDVALFKQQLDFFAENFNVIRMEQLMGAVIEGTPLPDRALLLTFDDGYADNYTYALPLLEEYGFQGSFFIPGLVYSDRRLLDVNKIHYILASAEIGKLLPDIKERLEYYRGTEYKYPSTDELWEQYAVADRFDDQETIFVKRILQTALPERLRCRIASDLFVKYVGVTEEELAYELYMSPEQIRMLKRHGMFIGIHGYDHYWLPSLPVEKMRRDISKAIEVMGEFIDRIKWVMNYPYGEYNNDIVDYIKCQGAVLGLTTEVRITDLEKESRWLLPRLDCNDFPPKTENYSKWQ